MTPTEMLEHLRAIANEFTLVAEQFESQAEQYSKCGNHAKAKDCLKEAEESRKIAKDARVSAQKIIDNDEKFMIELQQLEIFIDQDNTSHSREACKFLIILIKKLFLETKEPYSTHLRTCGEL